jgi:APA family basic amino acid/polyamine antiporter
VPLRGLLAVAVPAAVLVFWDDIGAVADTTNFVLFCAFAVVNAAVIWLRWRRPELERPFRTWGSLPFARHALPLFPTLAIVSLAVMLVSLSPTSILGGAGILALGLVLAYLFRGKREGAALQ